MTLKKLNITNHLQGWGLIQHHKGLFHFFKKNKWKSICGYEQIDDISLRWKIKFFPKNILNFPERKKCLRCLDYMKINEIYEF